MYPASFEYFRADSVDEAIALLGQHDDAKVLAGGHSLIPMMKLRLAQPAAVIDIGRIGALRGITRTDRTIRVGALTTHAEIADSPILHESCPLLAEAAAKVGDAQVRYKGTLGGNIAHADPASDLPAVLLAVSATIQLAGPDGERRVAAADFFIDLLTTDVAEHEILTAVEIDWRLANSGAAYLKYEHPASGYALCGAAAVVTLADDGSCEHATLCFNGVTGVPHHAAAVGEALAGSDLGDDAIARAIAEHLAIDDPLADLQASGPYRIEMAKVYGRRALALARDRARG